MRIDTDTSNGQLNVNITLYGGETDMYSSEYTQYVTQRIVNRAVTPFLGNPLGRSDVGILMDKAIKDGLAEGPQLVDMRDYIAQFLTKLKVHRE